MKPGVGVGIMILKDNKILLGLRNPDKEKAKRKIIEHLSSYELSKKIWNREYAFLERYFSEGYADESDYNDILTLLVFTNQNQTPSKEELKHLKIIFEIMSEHFHSKDEKQNINRVLELQKSFSLSNTSN